MDVIVDSYYKINLLLGSSMRKLILRPNDGFLFYDRMDKNTQQNTKLGVAR